MSKAIRAIQAQLQVEGYNISLDGVWGSNSQKALRQAIDNKTLEVYFDFDKYKKLFNVQTLTQGFVDGINGLYDAFNGFNTIDGTNPNYIAYMLATSYLETDRSMTAIKEYGNDKYFSKYGKGNLAKRLGNKSVADGIKYAGRGHVMITGRDNYQKFTDILGIDLINDPDVALSPTVSAKILVIGSIRGVFTTRKLSDYITYGSYQDFVDARRVINGVDRNKDIADYAIKFRECIIVKLI